MFVRRQQSGFIFRFLLLILIVVIGLWGYSVYKASETFQEFLSENKELKEAITRLTEENQIGYAKVIKQEQVNGKPVTTLVFYQTKRDDPDSRIFEGEYTIEGDVAHFDALVVKFNDQMVLDQGQRSIFLWRRIYGEYMTPQQGFMLEQDGTEPARYSAMMGEQTLWDKVLLKKDYAKDFWSAVWDLANDTDSLKEHGITAVYGNAVYTKLEVGKIYQFKINDAGQIYPEVITDL